MKLVTLEIDGETIGINLDHVISVRREGPIGTRIILSNGDGILVEKSVVETVEELVGKSS